MDFPENEFAVCRKLRARDNLRVQDAWIVEDREDAGASGLSLLKGKKAHLVCLQNGNISTAPSGRFRTGFWEGGTQHFASMEMLVDGKRSEDRLVKYVRRLHCIYRDYGGVERIDFIQHDKAGLCIALKAGGKHGIAFRFHPSHLRMWPDCERAKDYSVEKREGGLLCRSSIASTRYLVIGQGATVEFDGDAVVVSLTDCGNSLLYICSNQTEESDFNFADQERHHSSVKERCVLKTPDFRFNKAFLWAKHDLLEFYSETEVGDGFFAGFPEFSWFFGRDGEWMSMAAVECGMAGLADKHLAMLERHSMGGRMPHEVPIVNGAARGTYTVGRNEISTRFMSIDSTPLWVLCHFHLSRWTGNPLPRASIEKAVDFCISCDRDGDGLLENRLSEGLIGWPESWADRRDGACIEINAWWREALKEYNRLTGSFADLLEKCTTNFESTFFPGNGSAFAVADSMFDDRRRFIKNAMEIVPSMYERDGPYLEALKQLSGDDMLVKWGMRSISSGDTMYDRGYHTGQVWPLMTGWFVLAAYNNRQTEEAFRLLSSFPLLSFSSPDPGRINEVYHPEFVHPTGQFAQGWSSSLFIQGVVEGLFGIRPDGARGRKGLDSCTPNLPQGWERMSIDKLEYQGGLYDIRVAGNDTNVIERRKPEAT